ncbi:hypothetical protein CMEL01_05551 [Colletotrichum melonis]|uniref:Uncharacterized protein n=1 Tax=Colletotrichum melonis TaxID=1209925 RepID=A0AAI9UBE4_9PEZI|nr:hypothetical protein CMEL01_05551 [Colletotrichum melonis]
MIYPYSVYLIAVASPGWYTTFLRQGKIPDDEVLLASRSKVSVPSRTRTLPYSTRFEKEGETWRQAPSPPPPWLTAIPKGLEMVACTSGHTPSFWYCLQTHESKTPQWQFPPPSLSIALFREQAQEPVRQSLGQPTTAYNRQITEAHSFTDTHFKELIPSLSWMEIHGVRPARLEVPYQRQKGNPLDALESMAYPTGFAAAPGAHSLTRTRSKGEIRCGLLQPRLKALFA